LQKHKRDGTPVRKLSREASALMQAYNWPGNIRELENEIERLLVLGSDNEEMPEDLVSSRIREAVGSPRPLSQVKLGGKLHAAVEALEREMIHQGLVRTAWNKSRLARELGVSRSNLILKIEKYGLDKPPPGMQVDEAQEYA
jgi:DNA-binding NtrC family response regulator